MLTQWSPIINSDITTKPWQGRFTKKPWNFGVEVAIPVINNFETLPYVIDLLRLQTIKPHIVVIDTGSSELCYQKISQMRAEDVEIHSLRFNGVKHPSDYPAIAMDLMMSLCRTKYLFCTHNDVFLQRRDVIEELIDVCDDKTPAVGYQMSPRDHKDWEDMVSHTCTMLHMPTMDKIGAGWSLRRLCNNRQVEHKPNILGANWPDTEILLNYILWENGYKAKLIGKEENQKRTVDDRIDHCRTLTAGRLYSPKYAVKVNAWVVDAINKAKERIEVWREQDQPIEVD